MKMIDKDAVAEVEKIRKNVKRLRYAVDANCIVTARNACECLESSIDLLVNSINTLEVKDVDFDAEWKKYFEHRGEITTVNIKHLAKHFFKLGLKAQKGEQYDRQSTENP